MPIERLAVLLRVLTWGGAVLVVLMPALAWLSPADGNLTNRSTVLAPHLAGYGTQWIVLALLFPPYLFVAWGLLQLSGFCRRLARREHFTRAAASALKRFGWSLVAAAVVLPLSRLAARWYLALSADSLDPGIQMIRTLPVLAVALGIILGLIVVVFAALLEQATELAEENARFL